MYIYTYICINAHIRICIYIYAVPRNLNGTESIASGGATSISSGGVTSTNVDIARRSLTDFSVRKDCEVDVARWGVDEEKEEVELSAGCCGMFMGRRNSADNPQVCIYMVIYV